MAESRTQLQSGDRLRRVRHRSPRCGFERGRGRIKGYATPMTARTPRGGSHAYFRAPDTVPLHPRTRIEGLALDLRAGASRRGRSQLEPGARVDVELERKILAPDQLPSFDPDWLPLDHVCKSRSISQSLSIDASVAHRPIWRQSKEPFRLSRPRQDAVRGLGLDQQFRTERARGVAALPRIQRVVSRPGPSGSCS